VIVEIVRQNAIGVEYGLGRLYSTEFYALASRALAPGGLMVVQAGRGPPLTS
jgi:predicted membrane-bound spermidine synthase